MNKTTIFILVALVAGAGLFYNFTMKGSSASSWQVEYVVSCSECDVNYTNEENKSVIEKGVKGTWSKKFTGQPFQFTYVSAMPVKSGSEATVRLLKDGQEVQNGSSSDAFTTAKASTTLFN